MPRSIGLVKKKLKKRGLCFQKWGRAMSEAINLTNYFKKNVIFKSFFNTIFVLLLIVVHVRILLVVVVAVVV